MGINLPEAIINHVDSGDLLLDILGAQVEFVNDPYSFGVRVNNMLNDFKDKIEAENSDPDVFVENLRRHVDKIILDINAAGDHKLKESKEL